MTRGQGKFFMLAFGVSSMVCRFMNHRGVGIFLFGWMMGIAFCLPDLKRRGQ